MSYVECHMVGCHIPVLCISHCHVLHVLPSPRPPIPPTQLEYARICHEAGQSGSPYHATGGHLSVAAGRVSFVYGLKGPAMAIDTGMERSPPERRGHHHVGICVSHHVVILVMVVAASVNTHAVYISLQFPLTPSAPLYTSPIPHTPSPPHALQHPSSPPACSSSLVATHLALDCLSKGTSTHAVVVGVNLTLVSSWTEACQRANMLSPDGRCGLCVLVC